jgi:uncharacterized protein
VQATAATTRALTPRDRDLWQQALALIDADPVTNCFVASRLEQYRHLQGAPEQSRIGAEIWAHVSDHVEALCYSGANLVPVGLTTSTQVHAFAAYAVSKGRRCSSIVGPAVEVMALWHELNGRWGPPREIRENQPMMVTSREPEIDGDPLVVRLAQRDLDALLPASMAMFEEEVGISPLGNDGGATYRARVRDLLEMGQVFGRIEDGRVIFKAEIGALTPAACQIQGVWVDPELRGTGLGTRGMASVVRLALEVAPVVSLYVNDFNLAARRCYEKTGFRQSGAFATILF